MIRSATEIDVEFLMQVAERAYPSEFNRQDGEEYLRLALRSDMYRVFRGDSGALVALYSSLPWNKSIRVCWVQFLAWPTVAPFEMVAACRAAWDYGKQAGFPEFKLTNDRGKIDLAPLGKRLGLVPRTTTTWESPQCVTLPAS